MFINIVFLLGCDSVADRENVTSLSTLWWYRDSVWHHVYIKLIETFYFNVNYWNRRLLLLFKKVDSARLGETD